ncbi:MAG: FecCD family ABC transporter permease [Syntrophobacteraceae bacterium]
MSTEILCRGYVTRSRHKKLLLLLAVLLLVTMAATGLSVGASGVGPFNALKSLFVDTGRAHTIVWLLRMPRVVMAMLVGFGLGIAGTVFQAILKNPLASPFTLGIGSGAGFGAVVVIIFFGGGLYPYLTAASAFAFSLVSAFLILGVAKTKRASSETMILTGIAQMFLFSALSAFFQYMGTMQQVYEITFWHFGSLSKAGWREIGFAALMVLPPFPFLVRRAWDFNLLATGDESALALGVDVEKLRMWSVTIASLMTAGCICFTGVIGFVGLVAPHIVRMTIGSDHQFLIPASGLIGGLLVLTADILANTVWAPQVIPIGIMTSFIGVPFFFYLLMKRTREYW